MNFSNATQSMGIAAFQSQALAALLGSRSSDTGFTSLFTGLLGLDDTTQSPLSALVAGQGAAPTMAAGRNMALSDPESAYRMMTEINRRDVYYKAQYAELSQMATELVDMEDAGSQVAQLTTSSSNDDIKTELRQFVQQYNDWVSQFDADLQQGGLLADTQAAQVSQYELEQSVKNMFNGAKDGIYGLPALGITISGNRMAVLDENKLDAMLNSNRQGVVATLQEFGANFTKSADLLNSEGNFMPRQLDNLKRGIQFITENKTDLQAEFGMGDSAKPSGKIAQALAAYQQTYTL